MPKAPGTWGSAAALPFAWFITRHFGALGLLAAVILCSLIGWAACSVYVRLTGAQDPKEVVIDEVAGQWLVLTMVPPDIAFYALGFLIFRILDITKPWPAGWADKHIHGGLGIMLDDLLAAAYGAALTGAAYLWWSKFA